jgi:osmotically-inducible protein OsmY
MRFFLRLCLLFVVVMALAWVFRGPILERLGLVAGASARQPDGQPSDLDLSVEKIAQELRATGRVVRRKVAAAGRQLEESTRDARTTGKLKARFALDPELKTRDIEVATDDGRVTLNGRVESHEEVARAIRMAVEEDDVLEVISTLQVTSAQPTPTPRP